MNMIEYMYVEWLDSKNSTTLSNEFDLHYKYNDYYYLFIKGLIQGNWMNEPFFFFFFWSHLLVN